MLDMQNPEDRKIRTLLLAASAFVSLGLITTVLVVAVMISVNFNFMDWME